MHDLCAIEIDQTPRSIRTTEPVTRIHIAVDDVMRVELLYRSSIADLEPNVDGLDRYYKR